MMRTVLCGQFLLLPHRGLRGVPLEEVENISPFTISLVTWRDYIHASTSDVIPSLGEVIHCIHASRNALLLLTCSISIYPRHALLRYVSPSDEQRSLPCDAWLIGAGASRKERGSKSEASRGNQPHSARGKSRYQRKGIGHSTGTITRGDTASYSPEFEGVLKVFLILL